MHHTKFITSKIYYTNEVSKLLHSQLSWKREVFVYSDVINFISLYSHNVWKNRRAQEDVR